MSYVVYVLECNDGSYYIGITTDIEKRLKEHNGFLSGGAKYTKGRRPVKVLYQEEARDKSTALKREIFLKKLTKSQKRKLLSV